VYSRWGQILNAKTTSLYVTSILEGLQTTWRFTDRHGLISFTPLDGNKSY
jgi:hypothetical protein